MIMAVLSSDGQRVLLGRQKRWPPNWYSTLAGFVEPAESVEDAVRREVWEESGIVLGRVVIHSTQPWPYPANLMIGAIAQAVPGPAGEEIVLTNDPELEHARWVDLDEVKEALRYGTSGLGEPPPKGYKEGKIRLPPRTAIANRLLDAALVVFDHRGHTDNDGNDKDMGEEDGSGGGHGRVEDGVGMKEEEGEMNRESTNRKTNYDSKI